VKPVDLFVSGHIEDLWSRLFTSWMLDLDVSSAQLYTLHNARQSVPVSNTRARGRFRQKRFYRTWRIASYGAAQAIRGREANALVPNRDFRRFGTRRAWLVQAQIVAGPCLRHPNTWSNPTSGMKCTNKLDSVTSLASLPKLAGLGFGLSPRPTGFRYDSSHTSSNSKNSGSVYDRNRGLR
jgi:hypothetical protein